MFKTLPPPPQNYEKTRRIPSGILNVTPNTAIFPYLIKSDKIFKIWIIYLCQDFRPIVAACKFWLRKISNFLFLKFYLTKLFGKLRYSPSVWKKWKIFKKKPIGLQLIVSLLWTNQWEAKFHCFHVTALKATKSG